MLSQLSPFASLMIGLFLAPPLGLAQPVTDSADSSSASPDSLQARVQADLHRLDEVRELTRSVAQSLRSFPEASDDAIEQLTKQNEELRALLSAEGVPTDEDKKDSSSVDALERELAKLAEERDRLQHRQAELVQVSDSAKETKTGLRVETTLRGREPVPILLVKNRIVPYDNPYFAVAGRVGSRVVIQRVRDGVSIREALEPGGVLDALLRKSDPDKKFVQLLVCSDSIPAFRAVAEFISKRGFAYGWDTSKDDLIVLDTNAISGSSKDLPGYEPDRHGTL